MSPSPTPASSESPKTAKAEAAARAAASNERTVCKNPPASDYDHVSLAKRNRRESNGAGQPYNQYVGEAKWYPSGEAFVAQLKRDAFNHGDELDEP